MSQKFNLKGCPKKPASKKLLKGNQPVCNEAKCSEDDHDGYLLLDVREDPHYSLPYGGFLDVLPSAGQHVDPQCARRSGGVLKTRSEHLS